MIKAIKTYIFTLLVVVGGLFIIHNQFLKGININLDEIYLLHSYGINFFLAFFILMFITIFQKRFFDYLGFIFITGSLLKFGVYFIFLHPKFKADQHITTLEATSFLVPYFICLAIEVYFVSKILNQNS